MLTAHDEKGTLMAIGIYSPNRIERRGLPPGAMGVIVGEADPERRELLALAYRTVPVPEELQAPLTGEPMQRAALRDYDRQIGEYMEIVPETGRPAIIRWVVTQEQEIRYTRTVTVMACSPEEAIRRVRAGQWERGSEEEDVVFGPDDGEWETTEEVEEE